MKHYKTIGLMFVFALMMLVTGASAQTDKESAVKAAAPAAAAAVPEIVSSPAAGLFVSPAVQASSPFQVGHKYLVTSTQTSKFFYILVDAIRGDWVQVKVFETTAPDKPVFGSGMWYNTIYLTSASEIVK